MKLTLDSALGLDLRLGVKPNQKRCCICVTEGHRLDLSRKDISKAMIFYTTGSDKIAFVGGHLRYWLEGLSC